MQIYPAKYTDKNGEFETTIFNDGKTLRMNVRDVEFLGNSFDAFRVEKEDLEKAKEFFTFDKFKCLYACKIECEIPIQVIVEKNEQQALLSAKVDLIENAEKDGIDYGIVFLSLKYQHFEFESQGKSGWFEDELLDIEKQLPNGHKLKYCFGCAYSDYSVYGHGFWGDMLCYRNQKENYKAVLTKMDFMKIMDFPKEEVQETYLCPEFEIRKPDTGYRG